MKRSGLYLFILLVLLGQGTLYAQSAIGQLETITGQKINRYNTNASSGYDMNTMVASAIAQGFINGLFSNQQYRLPVVRPATRQPMILITPVLGEAERVQEALRAEKHRRIMQHYKGATEGSMKYVRFRERNGTENFDSVWLGLQQKLIRERLQHENYWCKSYLDKLKKEEAEGKTLKDMIPHKKATELQPGDVILVGPTDSYFSQKQAGLDAWLNDNNAYVTHTLTCVKVVDGKRIFLDNQAEQGPRMISEDQFMNMYKDRSVDVAQLRQNAWGVAQPLSKEEGDALWNKARELAQLNRDNTSSIPFASNYGLYGNNNIVCSEASWQLINSTGRFQIPYAKNIPLISGMDFTPASFYNSQQYFIITPLSMQ